MSGYEKGCVVCGVVVLCCVVVLLCVLCVLWCGVVLWFVVQLVGLWVGYIDVGALWHFDLHQRGQLLE